jgi:translation initiation factor 3 subunit C
MIWNEELAASMDQGDGTIVFHRVELTRVQQMAQTLADKVSQLVEQNEKTLDAKLGGGAGWNDRVDGQKADRGDQQQERKGREGRPARGTARGGARGGRGAKFAQGLGKTRQ